jgi:hypothetical protein
VDSSLIQRKIHAAKNISGRGCDKLFNPRTVLITTQGSGKSTLMAHLPFSKKYVDYAPFKKEM